jgi:hypothetical protein
MANGPLEHRNPCSPGIDPVENCSLDQPAASSRGWKFTANTGLWFFGVVFLALAGFGFYVFFRVRVRDATQDAIIIPVAGAGALGLFLLVLAWCGVGSKNEVRLAGLDALADQGGVKSGDARAALARLQANARMADFPRGRSLPFFHVRFKPPKGDRARRIDRVFLTENEFLFISLHTSTLNLERGISRTTGMINGGLVAGLATGLVAGVNAYCQMMTFEEYRARTRALDGVTDEHLLRQFAGEDPESFTLPMQEIRDVRIEPPSVWDKFNGRGEIAAKVQLDHPEHGKLTLDLPCFDDVGKAMEELPKVFGNEVQITASWNSF